MKLLIVESPTKSKTLAKFLGKDFEVLSSYGHMRDLPKGKLGVDVENNFEPKYVIPTKSRKAVNALKKEAAKADAVILATDEDREGEAIAWHLTQALELDPSKTERIAFHEITKTAIQEAIEHPRKLDMHRVDAQQARRILDRLVGYKLSPFLWKKMFRGLSAGRVQSVAVRLIVDREKEIEAFKPEEYWSITAELTKEESNVFTAKLHAENGKKIEKLGIKNKKESDTILKNLEGAAYTVAKVEKKEKKKRPLPPFTTSTLQQTAWGKLKWQARGTMRVAQQLYEKGYITYHRTDSLNVSAQAISSAVSTIEQLFGKKYLADSPRRFKTKSKGAQEAHEAIRPSYPERTPPDLAKKLDARQLKLYELIWGRFMASQMSEAVFDAVAADITAGDYTFRATGQTLKFDGFLKVYQTKYTEEELPELIEKEELQLKKLLPEQHFTKPPARYTDASLIKALEEHNIGRPSTYAPIISTIQDRNYVEKGDGKSFNPTETGSLVNDLLCEHFPDIVDIDFTAKLEEHLDHIAEGDKKWQDVIGAFYGPFDENLEKKYEEVKKKEDTIEKTDKKCPKCGGEIIIRMGRFGKFYACGNFPECKHTESLEENTLNIKCPQCKKGKLTPKRTKKRKVFYGCDQYPDCDFALWDKPTGNVCDECKSMLVEKGKKIACSNKECAHHKGIPAEE